MASHFFNLPPTLAGSGKGDRPYDSSNPGLATPLNFVLSAHPSASAPSLFALPPSDSALAWQLPPTFVASPWRLPRPASGAAPPASAFVSPPLPPPFGS